MRKRISTGAIYSQDVSKQKFANYYSESMVDAPDWNTVLYTSGCLFACPSCWSKNVQNFNFGFDWNKDQEELLMKDLDRPFIKGLALLGGEPLLSLSYLLPIVRNVRSIYGKFRDENFEELPNSKRIWVSTGFRWEELLEIMEIARTERDSDSCMVKEFLENIDFLVDGRFEIENKDLTLMFRGSSNQRIIDVQKSLKYGKVCLWKNGDYK